MSDTAVGTYEIRWAEDKDWIPAMHMIWKTFLKFEAVDYTEEGIRNFYDFITDEHLYKSFLKKEEGERYMSLKAAPYAVEFYRKLGFHAVHEEEAFSGIRVTPMEKFL